MSESVTENSLLFTALGQAKVNDDRQSRNCAVFPWNHAELLLVTSVSLAVTVDGSFAVFLKHIVRIEIRSVQGEDWGVEQR